MSPPAVQRLRDLLHQAFRLDDADVCVGVPRLIAHRRAALVAFIDEQLVPSITARTGDVAAVCDSLSTFLARYLDGGDVHPLPRYQDGAYALPHDGSEWRLAWANEAQHHLGDSPPAAWIVQLAQGRLHLRVVQAEPTRPEPGPGRRLVAARPLVQFEGDDLIVRLQLVHAPGRQSSHLDEIEAAVLGRGKGLSGALSVRIGKQTVLRRHLDRFARRRADEDFVHRDLRGFLRRELDRFVVGEVLQADGLTTATLARAEAVRALGGAVADFLGELEDLRLRAFRRPKLVLRPTEAAPPDLLVSVDRLPLDLLPVVEANAEQLAAWRHDLGVAPQPGSLGEQAGLVVQTRFFDQPFSDRLLEHVGDLDEATTGWAVHGDNVQAMRLLAPLLGGRCALLCTDPPYNTGSDDFVYRDHLRHSAWLTMMRDRLEAARALLAPDGALLLHIDENEQARLALLLESMLGAERRLGTLIWKKKAGGSSDAAGFVMDHEYVLAWAMEGGASLADDPHAKVTTRYPHRDEHGAYGLERLDKQSLGYQASLDFPIEGPDGTYTVEHKDPAHKVARWRWSTSTVAERKDELVFRWPYVYTKNRAKDGARPRSLLVDERFGRTRRGKTELTERFGRAVMSFPKPLALVEHLIRVACAPDGWVVDPFAGSGTTGEAVLRLNRAEGARRRFVLVEQGDHFETVLRPRLLKAAYASAWAKGLPNGADPCSILVRVLRLESPRDALDSLPLDEPRPGTSPMAAFAEGLAGRGVFEDRRVQTSRDGAWVQEWADRETTFELLLGLRVRGALARSEGRFVWGEVGSARVLLAWRSCDDPALHRVLRERWPHLPFDRIYVLGDTDLGRHRRPDESWQVHDLEAAFVAAVQAGAGWGAPP